MNKTILCFGDSNTHGQDVATKGRFPKNHRWPGILLDHLGKGFEVIEEGLPGRTTVLNDPVQGKIKNGKKYLKPCLESHTPLDLVIFMLGTCDLKSKFNLAAVDIAQGMETLVSMVIHSAAGPKAKSPHILLLTPPPFGPKIDKDERYQGASAKLKELPALYSQIAHQYGCAFLDTQKFVKPPAVDSIHLDAKGHQKLGTAVAAMVNRIFK